MRETRKLTGLMAVLLLLTGAVAAATDPFSFSAAERQEREKERAAEAERARAVRELVSVPCRDRLKDRKILLLAAERSSGHWMTQQERYARLLDILDARLRALGLKTYSQQQIKASIAQAEMEAYFNNDPDAALAASKRLAAAYVLRGEIATTSGVNSVVGVNEVAVDVELTLTSAAGDELSRVESHSDSYSGHDTLATATDLLRQQADRMVAQLYNDYCRKAEDAPR